MSEIKPGSEVLIRATVQSVNGPWPTAENIVVEFAGPDPYRAQISAKLIAEVISDPLPPVPPLGAYVLLGRYYGVYEHAERGWIDANQATGPAYEWDALLRLNSGDAPVRLYRADEQPQEKYERAADVNSLAMWRHKCGNVTGWNPSVNPDTQMCPHCSKRGDWQQLYVKADSDG